MDQILFEPFRIKVVEPITVSSREDRVRWIEESRFNIFNLKSDQVMIDLLTDSGTGAMSDAQWGEMIQGDEAYAGSRSFLALEATARELTGMPYIIPVHQGRAAENLLFSTLLKGGETIPSNGLFDTTVANILNCNARGINLPVEEALDPFADAPFKGNIDPAKLEALLQKDGPSIPLVVMTLTNNTGGGQPVSLENLRQVREITRRHGKRLIIDACRFAENAYFIKTREPGMASWSAAKIAHECFLLCDGITFSAKKDGLSNIGGFLALRDEALANAVKDKMVRIEGFPTYGGLAGYSLAAMNQGLKEVLDERYLEYRLRTVSWSVEKLIKAGVPVVRPAGGHAVYIESSRFFPHIPREHFPGLALTTELYVEGGIRGCELGSIAFGYRDENGRNVFPPLDLVRLAFPRRSYTEAHIGYATQCIINVFERRNETRKGFEFEMEAPAPRHFRSQYRRIS